MTWLRAALFTLVFPGTVTVLAPWLILSRRSDAGVPPPSGPLRWVGLVPIVLGVLVYLRSARDFIVTGRGTPAPWDPPRELVATGLYRRTRNPLYVAVLSVVAGEAILFASPALALYALGVFLVFHLATVLYEEPTLERQFGEKYRRYREEVPRWLPRWRAR